MDPKARHQLVGGLGGGLYCAGTGAAIFGQRADLIICDDLIRSLEEAASSSQMMKLHDWITAELLTRLKPRGKLLSICQRLTLNDAHGFLLKLREAAPFCKESI